MLAHDASSNFYTDDEPAITVEGARGLRVAWTFDAGAFVDAVLSSARTEVGA